MSFFPCDQAAPAAPAGPVVEWEEADCLLCGSRHWSPLLEAPDTAAGHDGLWFAVVQCQDCGLCYTNPRPNARTIGQFYPEFYRPHRSPKRRKKGFRLRLPNLLPRGCKEGQVLPWHGQGRLLDFGCGGGSFLERMARHGWHVTGLDVCSDAVERIRHELGLRCLYGSLPHPNLQPGEFDVITMWHSLEHVHQPLEVLRAAYRLLAPGGRLLVATPNIDSLPFRWFRQAWFALDLPRHLAHFSPQTLELILERAGDQVEAVYMVRHSDWLRSSARLACRRRRGPHWHRWLTSKPASGVAAWYSYLTRQSDCMLASAWKT
jgi:SAM-dependent methyltransferase